MEENQLTTLETNTSQGEVVVEEIDIYDPLNLDPVGGPANSRCQ